MEHKVNELFITVINNGVTYEARSHAAAKFVQGYYNNEGFRKEIGAIVRKEATEYRKKVKVAFSPKKNNKSLKK